VVVKHAPDAALQHWLVAAVLADQEDQLKPGDFEAICYEFVTQALICFEEEISDSRRQYEAIFTMVGTLCTLRCLEPENYDSIVQKIVTHATRLLKKPMQCRAIAACAQLFWNEAKQDSKRVLECLQKCLKICDTVVQQDPKQVGLWVEMLDKYIYFVEVDVEDVTAKYIQSLLNLSVEHISFAENNDESKEEAKKAKVHLTHSQNYLKLLRTNNDEKAARFQELTF
jgi:vacuolar protein sorting-associated protein 35